MANDPKNPRVDEPTGTELMGHEWDGIEELDTPLPRWWLWTLYATIVWALIYVVLYPAWPLVNNATQGVLGWSSRGQLAQEIKVAELANQGVRDEIAAIAITNLPDNPELLRKAVAGGAAAFKVNCVQCHGAGAAGSPGYPNLNDDDWLWGGDLAAIEQTLQHGIRWEGSNQTRLSMMPGYGEIFSAAQIDALAGHVLSFTGLGQSSDLGAELFNTQCAACHEAGGQGNRTFGAPALNDAIWLYGNEAQDVRAQIANPRHGVMPGWKDRLDPVTIKMLAAYVHSLGGGEASAVVEPAEALAGEADGQQ